MDYELVESKHTKKKQNIYRESVTTTGHTPQSRIEIWVRGYICLSRIQYNTRALHLDSTQNIGMNRDCTNSHQNQQPLADYDFFFLR